MFISWLFLLRASAAPKGASPAKLPRGRLIPLLLLALLRVAGRFVRRRASIWTQQFDPATGELDLATAEVGSAGSGGRFTLLPGDLDSVTTGVDSAAEHLDLATAEVAAAVRGRFDAASCAFSPSCCDESSSR